MIDDAAAWAARSEACAAETALLADDWAAANADDCDATTAAAEDCADPIAAA